MNWVDIMLIKAVLFYCISFLTSPAWTKNCSGKFITNDICIPKDYNNRASQSAPNEANIVAVGLKRVILLDINPKKKTISVHINLLMFWNDNRLELQNYDSSNYFGMNDAVNLWLPNYSIKRYFNNTTLFYGLWIKPFVTIVSIYSLLDIKVYPIHGFEQLFWVSRNNATGSVRINQYFEFRAEVFCQMDLQTFPFDKQTCIFEVLPTYMIQPLYVYIISVFNF